MSDKPWWDMPWFEEIVVDPRYINPAAVAAMKFDPQETEKMNFIQWRDAHLEALRTVRLLRLKVRKIFIVPEPQGPAWAEIRTVFDEMKGEITVAVYRIGAGDLLMNELMDEAVIAAFLKVKQAVAKWCFDSAGSFPTPEELELIDGSKTEGWASRLANPGK